MSLTSNYCIVGGTYYYYGYDTFGPYVDTQGTPSRFSDDDTGEHELRHPRPDLWDLQCHRRVRVYAGGES